MDEYFVGVYNHYVFGDAHIYMRNGSLYFQYLSLGGFLNRSQWRDKYHLRLNQHYSDLLEAPSDGFAVYFGKSRRGYAVDKMAVTALDRAYPPVFVRPKTSAARRVIAFANLFTGAIIWLTTCHLCEYTIVS